MSVWLDEHYLRQLSPKLPRFKAKGNHSYNARCIICGDSRTDTSKARWYAFPYKTMLMTKCHNCGYAQSFSVFLQTVDPLLYSHYNIQRLQENNIATLSIEQPEPQQVSLTDKNIFKRLRTVSQLATEHPAKLWIEARRIPSKHHYRLYYTSNFQKFTNSVIADKFTHPQNSDPRIILPLLAADKQTVIGFQGRTIDPTNKKRYITVILDQAQPKIFGLDQLDKSRTITVVEGPFDSLFLSNTIAVCGSDLTGPLPTLGVDKNKFTIVFDNQNRNQQLISQISKAIEDNYPVVIWPDSIEYKDINEMILADFTPIEIRNIIKENTFTGLAASLRLQQWRRV